MRELVLRLHARIRRGATLGSRVSSELGVVSRRARAAAATGGRTRSRAAALGPAGANSLLQAASMIACDSFTSRRLPSSLLRPVLHRAWEPRVHCGLHDQPERAWVTQQARNLSSPASSSRCGF